MEYVTPTAFWSTVSIIAAAIGSSFLLTVSHANEPRHPDAASESDVSEIKIQVTRVAADVGYNRAARMIEAMEMAGVVGPLENGKREVLAPAPPE